MLVTTIESQQTEITQLVSGRALRYFAATLDDEEARNWAKAEVGRLDNLASLQEQYKRSIVALEIKETAIERLKTAGQQASNLDSDAIKNLEYDIIKLKQELINKDIQVEEQRQKAGIEKDEQKFWVVVGSVKEREKANRLVDEINSESNDISAFLGIFNPATGYYPVIAGYGSYLEAQAIMKKALSLNSVTDAYLSLAD